MAKQIKGTEIIQDDHLANAIKSAKELKIVYDELDKSILKTAKDAKKGLGGIDPNSASGIQKINAEVTKSINLKKQSKTVTDQLRKANDLEVQGKIRLAEANRKQRADLKLKIQLDNAEAGSLNKLSLTVKKYEQELRTLNLTTATGRKRQQELITKINQSNDVFKKNSSALSQQRIGIGKYSNALKGAGASMRSFAGAFGLTSGIFLFAQGLKDAVKLIADFEQSNANLASILGTTKEGIFELTEDAKRLGQTTANTASEITKLQTELAKLGFTRKEILASTEAIQKLAQATGTDLAQSAIQVGGALRTFGLDASEAERVVDVLASSTSKSALDMSKLATALPIVGSTAKVAGLGIERTTALLGVLSDTGIDASTAGTSLRNIFLELSKQGLTWEQAMEQINGATEKNAVAMDLFGKRGATAGIILAENGGKADELTKALLESGGTAQEMADTQLDTLSGSLTLLKSSYEGFILSLESGDGTLAKFAREVIESATALLQLASGVEATDDVLKKFELGNLIVDFKEFFITLGSTFESMEAFKESWRSLQIVMIDTINAFQNFISGGLIKDISKDYLDASDSLDKYESSQREAIRISALAQKGIKKLGESVTEYVGKEQRRIDLLVKGNLSTEQQAKLIGELNEKYPELLENYDLENLSQEDAIKLQQELKREIIETAIIKQKALVMSVAEAKIEAERLKISKITNSQVREQKERELEFEIKRQFARIDAVEEETRIRLGLKDADDDITDELINNDTATTESKKSSNKAKEEEQKRHNDEIKKINKEDLKNNNIVGGLVIDGRVDPQIAIDEKLALEKKAQEELIEMTKKMYSDLNDLLQNSLSSSIDSIDNAIQDGNDKIAESETRINDLKDQAKLGNLDAKESIKAEQQAIANEKESIAQLEKKKKNLQIIVTGLALANQKIQNGDGNALSSASNEMGGFVKSLKGFYKGTDTTLGDDLGGAYAISGDKDTHIIKAHKDEHIIGVDNSRKLGKMKQDDIVKGALMLKNGEFVGQRAVKGIVSQNIFNDSRMISAMSEVKQAIKDIKIPEHKFNYDAITKIATETIRIGNKTTNNHRKIDKGIF